MQKNLENLTQAIRACRNSTPVLGVHYYGQPDKLLDLSKLSLPSVPYSVGGPPEFAFVFPWFN
ncbi:hypothetical protein Q8G71_34705, partial [Klebsiella pneumoniae]